MRKNAPAPKLRVVSAVGASAGRLIGVIHETAGQRLAGLALIEGGHFCNVVPAHRLVIEAAARHRARREGAPGLPGIDGIAGFGGVGTLKTNPSQRIGDIDRRPIGQHEHVDRMAILPSATEVPGDAFLSPESHEEIRVALPGLHRESPCRVVPLQTIECKPERGSENTVTPKMLGENLLGNLRDGKLAKDPPCSAMGENTERTLNAQFENRRRTIRQDLLDSGDDSTHPTATAHVVANGKPHRQTLDIFQGQLDVIPQALHAISPYATDALLALRTVGDQLSDGFGGTLGKTDLEDANRLRKRQQRTAYGGVKTGF